MIVSGPVTLIDRNRRNEPIENIQLLIQICIHECPLKRIQHGNIFYRRHRWLPVVALAVDNITRRYGFVLQLWIQAASELMPRI